MRQPLAAGLIPIVAGQALVEIVALETDQRFLAVLDLLEGPAIALDLDYGDQDRFFDFRRAAWVRTASPVGWSSMVQSSCWEYDRLGGRDVHAPAGPIPLGRLVLLGCRSRGDCVDHVVRLVKPDPFDKIIRLIETAGQPFPAAVIRRLILRATSRAKVTPELADAIDRLNASILVLDRFMNEISTDPIYPRHDALDALARMRAICSRSVQ